MSLAAASSNVPILCIQEHFLLKGNLFKLDQAFPGHHIVPKAAVKETLDRGRAKNGMAIIVPEIFKNNITDVLSHHWRVQAVIVSCRKSKILLINSYLPNDIQNANENDIGELLETLEAIRNLVSSTTFDSLMLLGDLNADFIRNSKHCIQLKRFIQELGLERAWDRFEIDFTYCQEVNNVPRYAVLDHFLWNTNLTGQITEAGAIHSPENASDHEAIYCIVDASVDAAI